MQHQQYESVAMDQLLPSQQAVVEKYVNNNNNNMNKNIHIMTSSILTSSFQSSDVIIFDPEEINDTNSSLNTKEIITVAASQPLYENSSIIPLITTTTTSSTLSNATSAVNHTNQNHSASRIFNGTQVPVRTVPSQLVTGDGNVQNDNRSHEYALISTVCDRETIVVQDQVSSINKYHTIRPDDQRESPSDALRRIEDVHNYSKTSKTKMDESTNSSSPEDDDEDDVSDDMDDVFEPPNNKTIENYFKNHVANRNNCDTSASKQAPLNKQSQQQKSHHREIFNSFDEIISSTTPTISSPTATIAVSSSSKSDTMVSSTSPKSINSPTIPTTCADVPDDVEKGEHFDEMNGSGGVNGDKTAPDHHARRPMNAFLIFCKRHRAIVRDKYKNLENRQITKILGEWWATLSDNEKACYTDLAKQYKDAFFKANPNFKWYKLPAPPLRTCTIRPGHQSPTSPNAPNYNYHASDVNGTNDDGMDRFNCDNGYVRKTSTSFLFNADNIFNDSSNNRNSSNSSNSVYNQRKLTNNVGVFKLADEAQMGSLSQLCGRDGSSSSSSSSPNANGSDNANSTNANDNNSGYTNDSQANALQNALGETSDFLSVAMGSCEAESDPYQNMRDHANRMETNQMLNGKRKASEEHITWNASKKPYSPTESNECRASRSCKGKRYQEFIISGQITSCAKKINPKPRTSATVTSLNGLYKRPEHLSEVGGNHAFSSYNQTSPQPNHIEIIIPDRLEANSPYGSQPQLDSPNSQKQFDASDFDLEEKIKALPAQCLESYLLRKRETKKKKKISSKRRPATSSSAKSYQVPQNRHQQCNQRPSSPKTIFEARERLQNAMVGSQKRKARKESITRRDVNTLNSSSAANSVFDAVGLVQLTSGTNGCDAKIKVELDPDNYVSSGQLVDGMMTIIKKEPENITTNTADNSTPTSDLLILAEVATNHIAE